MSIEPLVKKRKINLHRKSKKNIEKNYELTNYEIKGGIFIFLF